MDCPGSDDGGRLWRTFIGHLTDNLLSINWFQLKFTPLKNHRVLGILNPFTRQIVGYDIHCGPVDDIAGAVGRVFDKD